MSGLFGYLAAQDAAEISDSRARMIRNEAEAEATRYSEQAQNTLARTKLQFLKSGVMLSGSPLDVLDHDILTAQENIASIRAGGDARALDQENQATQQRIGGRLALIQGITGGMSKVGQAAYYSGKSSSTSEYDRKDVNSTGSTGWRGTPYRD